MMKRYSLSVLLLLGTLPAHGEKPAGMTRMEDNSDENGAVNRAEGLTLRPKQ